MSRKGAQQQAGQLALVPTQEPAASKDQAAHHVRLAHAFGVLPAAIRDAVISLGDDVFAFLTGRHIAVCDHVRNRLSFLPRDPRNRVITAAARSPSGKLLAVAERVGGEDGSTQITILSLPKPDVLMDVASSKTESKDNFVLRVLHPANRKLDIVDLAFTGDGKFLASLSTAPESTLTYWRWDIDKAVSSHDIQLPVTRLQVNPRNFNQLSISGPNYMRLWEFNPNDNQLRDHPSMFPLKREKQMNVVDHCWVLEQYLCAATEDGHVYLFADGEQRADIDVLGQISKDEADGALAVERAQARLLQAAIGNDAPGKEIKVKLVSLATWGGGFVVGGDQGYLGVFKVDHKLQVEPFGTFRMPGEEGVLWQMSAGSEDTCLAVLSYTEREVEDPEKSPPAKALQMRRTLSSRPNTTSAIGLLSESGTEMERTWSLTTFPVGQADLAATGQLEVFAPVNILGGHGNHHGLITGMGVSTNRRVLATCGADLQLKVWNYPSDEMQDQPNAFTSELSIQVSPDEKPKALAVHPLGFQVAVILENMLRIFHLTAQQVTRTLFDLPLKHPGDVAYSHGGNLLAVASENDVILLDPWKSVLVHMFTGRGGHLSPVNQVLFSADDRLLLSCCAAPHGAIYGWDLESDSKERTFEHVAKGSNYASLAYDFRRQLVVACARVEGCLRLVGRGEASAVLEIPPEGRGAGYTTVCLAAPLGMLFAGTQQGSVKVFAWPLVGKDPKPFIDVALHAHSITVLALSPNAKFLFSGCLGGTVMACHVATSATNPAGERHTLTSTQLDDKFVSYRYREDVAATHRQLNREDERKMHDLQRKLAEAGQGFSNHVASMDELLVVPKMYFNDCLHEVKELEERTATLEHQSEYTLEHKEHEITEKLHQMYNERKAERQRADDKYDAMYQQFKKASERHQEELTIANNQFEQRTRELQKQFEGGISKEYDKQGQLLAELQSLRNEYESQRQKDEERHQAQLDELRGLQEKAIREWSTKYNDLCNLLKSDSFKFEEVLRQQEQEYEGQISEILEQERMALQVESDKSTMALKDVVSMKQTISMLQRQLKSKDDELTVAAGEREKLHAKVQAAQEMFLQVQEQLKERERGLKVKDETLAKMREQMKHLESFRFVLFHKVRALEEERDPLELQVNSLKSSVREMYGEFVREFRHKQNLDQQLRDKSTLSSALQNENVELRSQLHKLRNHGRSLLQDVENILYADNMPDFERMPKRLQEVLDKYKVLKEWAQSVGQDIKEKMDNQTPDVVAKETNLSEEIAIQRDLLFRKNQIGVESANQAKRECSQEKKKLSAENAQLIVEMNTLRNENRSWQRSCKELEADVNALKAKTAAALRDSRDAKRRHQLVHVSSAPTLDTLASASAAATQPHARRHASGETPFLQRKIVDQQEMHRRHQQRLRNQLPPLRQSQEGFNRATNATSRIATRQEAFVNSMTKLSDDEGGGDGMDETALRRVPEEPAFGGEESDTPGPPQFEG